MAVHMVRLFIEPPKGDAETAVNEWVTNHNEWTNDPVEHSLVETNAEIDGSGTTYVRGDYRFIQDSTVTDLLDSLESNLQSIQGGLWYRVGYHNCTHDEDNPQPCSWDDKRENGTIPSDIPTIEVTN
jgi:hypothetical protein